MLKKVADHWNKRIWLLLLLGPYLAKILEPCPLSISLVLFIVGLVVFELIYATILTLVKNKYKTDLSPLFIISLFVSFYYDQLIEFVLYLNAHLFHLSLLKARYYIPLLWIMGVYLCQKQCKNISRFSKFINAFLLINAGVILGSGYLQNTDFPEGRQPEAGLQHHSDQGCQYTSHAFQRLLKSHGIVCSMSGIGNCYDNAAMESFFHTLKTECVYFERYENREQAKNHIFEYTEVFYNNQRRHSTLGYVSPAEFERRFYQRQLCS